MAQINYDEVVKLVEQLSHTEQEALAAHLQRLARQRKLTSKEWETLFDSMKISVPLGENFSLNREDWYDDDGR